MLSKDTGVPSSVKNRDPHGKNPTQGLEIGKKINLKYVKARDVVKSTRSLIITS